MERHSRLAIGTAVVQHTAVLRAMRIERDAPRFAEIRLYVIAQTLTAKLHAITLTLAVVHLERLYPRQRSCGLEPRVKQALIRTQRGALCRFKWRARPLGQLSN